MICFKQEMNLISKNYFIISTLKTNLQHSPDGSGILFCEAKPNKKDTADSG